MQRQEHAEQRPPVTVEIVAELPSLAALAAARQTVADDASEQRSGMRVQPVLDGEDGDDAWALRVAEDAAIAGEPVGGAGSGVALYRAAVPVGEPGNVMLLRCQLLHAGTASDATGRRWNAALRPTEEALIAFEVVSAPVATVDVPPAQSSALPIPGRAGAGRVRPGIHTIRLVLGDGDNVEVSTEDA